MCYQLQQKRRVLNELKAELEYCRKKWALARTINQESEKQFQEMKNEFVMRKQQDQKSYSDDHHSDNDDHGNDIVMSENKHKEKRFNKNLNGFYRNSFYLLDSNRRRSLELPIIYKIISETSPNTSRALSEPPYYSNGDQVDFLKILPDQNVEKEKSQVSCVYVEKENTLESLVNGNVQIILPPNVLNLEKKSTKIVKTKLGGSKEKRLSNVSPSNETESAEQMFCRLNRSINCAISSSSEEFEDKLEAIEEIPLDVNRTENKCKESLTTTGAKSIDSVSNFDYLQKREQRLARLEAETKEFYEKMTRNKQRGKDLDDRLASVHKNFLERQKEKSESQLDENTPTTSSNNQISNENQENDNENLNNENDL